MQTLNPGFVLREDHSQDPTKRNESQRETAEAPHPIPKQPRLASSWTGLQRAAGSEIDTPSPPSGRWGSQEGMQTNTSPSPAGCTLSRILLRTEIRGGTRGGSGSRGCYRCLHEHGEGWNWGLRQQLAKAKRKERVLGTNAEVRGHYWVTETRGEATWKAR